MQERAGQVTMQGNPMTLLGPEPAVGSPAPDFTSLSKDLKPISLADTAGKVRIFCSIPSLDTSVCSLEIARFDKEASQLGDGIQVYAISMDLPFAQTRWCKAQGASSIQTLSDHRDAGFGAAYGVLIKELRLLARAVFVVDKQDTLRYYQLVKEATDEPDYDAAIAAAKASE